MKITDLILLHGIDRVLQGKKTDDVVDNTAALVDKYLDERFQDRGSDKLKRTFVQRVLFPLCRKLCPDKTQYLADLNAHKDEVLHEESQA